VKVVQDELDADEGEAQRQPGGEVDEAVEQARDEEVEGLQAKQREGVGGEDDEPRWSACSARFPLIDRVRESPVGLLP